MVVEIDGVRYAVTEAGTKIPADWVPLAEDIHQQRVEWEGLCCTLAITAGPNHECWGSDESADV